MLNHKRTLVAMLRHADGRLSDILCMIDYESPPAPPLS